MYARYRDARLIVREISAATQLAMQFEQADTLAEILRLALDDFKVVLDDPRYDIDIALAPAIGGSRLCPCPAGVMAKRFGAGIALLRTCTRKASPWRRQLVMLDDLQSGNVDNRRRYDWNAGMEALSADNDLVKSLPDRKVAASRPTWQYMPAARSWLRPGRACSWPP